MPNCMEFIWFIIPAIGPIISRACSGMESSWARFMCSATGLTSRFHIGMVWFSHCSAFHACAFAPLAGRSVASSNHSSTKRRDSSAARVSASETGLAPAMRWRAMRAASSKFTASPDAWAFMDEPMPESIWPSWLNTSPKPPPPGWPPPKPNAANGLFASPRPLSLPRPFPSPPRLLPSPSPSSFESLGKEKPNPLVMPARIQSGTTLMGSLRASNSVKRLLR